jgi:hypothetical protein
MAKKEFALLYFESGATSFYVWFESRIIPFHAGQPEKERSVRENGAALVVSWSQMILNLMGIFLILE